jgi:hypothetical protein
MLYNPFAGKIGKCVGSDFDWLLMQILVSPLTKYLCDKTSQLQHCRDVHLFSLKS